MIIVNTPGGGATPFSPLLHAHWHGFTPTDLVFPSFLFAVGNAMSFSMDKYKTSSNASYLKKVFTRAFLIFIIGYLMYWFPFFRINDAGEIVSAPIAHTRIMGVLQRIALAYLFASLLIHYLSTKKVVVISILLLVGYWIILLAFGNRADPLGMLGNSGTYLDKWVLGDNHLYHGEGVAFDPEGILSTMTAIVNVIVGFYAGKFIRTNGKNYETISKMMLLGVAFIFVALCWNMVFPINKKLWSSSFVMLTTGIDLLLISALVYIVEIKNRNDYNWTFFFVVFGMNPLFIYIISELLVTIMYMVKTHGQSVHGYISTSIFQAIAPGAVGSFLFAIVYMLVCWLVGLYLYRRKIYIRV